MLRGSRTFHQELTLDITTACAAWGACCLFGIELQSLHRFGEDTMATMLEWVTALLRQHRSGSGGGPPLSAAILDVGTGNGVLPLELARLGYTNITGPGAPLTLPSMWQMAHSASWPAALLRRGCFSVQLARHAGNQPAGSGEGSLWCNLQMQSHGGVAGRGCVQGGCRACKGPLCWWSAYGW